MTQSCSVVHSGLEFVEQTAELVWQTATFLELWGRVAVNPNSCFVNAGECSVRKINLSSLFIKRAATIASARLNGGITLKLFMMSWKPVLTSRCSISMWDYSSTARGVWPESARVLHWSRRTPKCLQIKRVLWRCWAQNARRYQD